ncbi:MAG TPA: ribosome biogenesis GTPase YlqF [Clostridiales bacterium]|nr:ribosome biogenesis GTPase YlqF [Clostridia bacterium]HCS75283.1 ribosome biogenesis GTPase YlqF [Clostridiales bacterium]
MNINWYPGHMAKAKRMMNENLKLVDMVIELLDARIPNSSTNPEFQGMYHSKIRVVVLNKSDYADAEKTKLWKNYYKNQSITVAAINSLNKKDIQQLKKTLFSIADEKQKEIKQRKGINKTIRAMVVGIPNVGKSTLINAISDSAKAKTGDRPGVTKAKQWVKINPYFELLDTPGLLWPKLGDEKTGLHLAYTGSIREEIMDMEEIAVRFLEEMTQLYPQLLTSRYRLENLDKRAYELLADIALNRGWLQTGGIPDISRAARQVLDEYQSGIIGRTTLELP